ncbi:hypothetical protein [Ornithinimicrobium cerasi]|uniref:DoxX-like family protein n=1 Tax=Ornithinimicrobium cerasi TaxID=2248773 RepID=A0A285VE09_9MICO|nr:hypothetical protein [Ornithinimicrobium cerasi]SOC52310.1 hypothetical protein SAMN05421879_101484 [Ornithinimicrobium cerasi]
MTIDAPQRPPRAARIITLSLEAVTAVGAVAGVQGFLSGAFDPLVDQLSEVLPFVDGRALPAAALGGLVALPQAGALLLGLRRHPLAADAGLAVGAALTIWVGLQLPLIGFSSPVQWAFLAVGVVQVVAAALWRRGR